MIIFIWYPINYLNLQVHSFKKENILARYILEVSIKSADSEKIAQKYVEA